MKKKKYIKVAKEVIDLEIKALYRLKNTVNDSFNLAVEKILKCQSKVILCGVGKSGLIASKIASTLSSVGTPSFIFQQVTLLMGTWVVFLKKIF